MKFLYVQFGFATLVQVCYDPMDSAVNLGYHTVQLIAIVYYLKGDSMNVSP